MRAAAVVGVSAATRGLPWPRSSVCVAMPLPHTSASLAWMLVYVDHSSPPYPSATTAASVAAGRGDAVDVAAVEAAVLAEIKGSRSGAEHFRVVSVLGSGEFGYVFKVRTSVYKCTCVHAAGRCVRGCHRRQVCCTHPRHPNPRKQYALKLVINYATISRTPSIARRYGLDCVVLGQLPRHGNLCALLAEFISEVPDDMFEHLTPVRLRLTLHVASVVCLCCVCA